VVSEFLRFDWDRVSIPKGSLERRWSIRGIMYRSQISIGSVHWDHLDGVDCSETRLGFHLR